MTTNQTIDGVPREFVREGRYIVVKPDYEDDIRTERLRNYIEEMCFHTPDCVVVEADWPEYEPVWRMIEARVIGNPTELDAAKATISQLQGLVAELRALLDAPTVDPVPITDDMNRLMVAYENGEFGLEGGSETVEALSVASFDAVESHGHDADSYMAGYCAAMYEQIKPFLWLELHTRAARPQGEPVEWGAPKTVRQLIRQLETLDQDLRPLSMLRVPASIFEDGKERVRATHLSFSHERVDGQWLAPFKSDGEKVLAFWCRMEQPAPITVVQPFAEKVIRKLERFQECADDGQGADIGRHWFDLLTQLGLLNRVQRSPALWEMTQQGEDALELSRQSAKSR